MKILEENLVTANQWAERINKIAQLETKYIQEARELKLKLDRCRTEHGVLRNQGSLLENDDPNIPEKISNLEGQIKDIESQILNLEAAQKGLQTEKLEANRKSHEMRVKESVRNYKATESAIEKEINDIREFFITNNLTKKYEDILELHRNGDRICQEYQQSAGFLGIPRKGCPPRIPRNFNLNSLGEMMGDIVAKLKGGD